MPQKYRFVGTEMVIGTKKLTKFGEEIILTPEQRKDAGQKALLVHETLFAKVGFTEQELSLYMYPGQRTHLPHKRVEIPEAFFKKLREVWSYVGQEPQKEAKPEVTK